MLGYDGFGHPSVLRDALGNERRLVSDAAGRVTSMEDASGAVTAFEYDAAGNRTAVVDPAGSRTELRYDAMHRLVAVVDAQGHVSRTEYDPEGNVTARVDALGKRSEYRYDAIGRLYETVDATGAVTTQAYCADASSQPCGMVDPLGNLLVVELDALGRAIATIDPGGNRTEEHYDLRGRRDWSRDGLGRVTRFEYDDVGRLLSVRDPAGGVTAYGYDARGNRTLVRDANGHETIFTYDLANRLVSERNPIGAVTTYGYDAAGNRAFKLDGNGARTEYDHDANRRLTAVRFADGTSYRFGYDARGNRTVEQSPTHSRTLSYDALGRLGQVKDETIGRTISYSYDAAGNRTRMNLDTGETVTYRWDAAGRLAEQLDPQGASTRFVYDAAGRRARVVYGNNTTASYGYDQVGQVESIVYASTAGEVLTAFGYGYDAAGNRKHKAFADGTKEQYGYDALDRLTRVDYPGGRQVEYGYDAVGNRTTLVDSGRPGATRWPVSAVASSFSQPASNLVGPSDARAWQPLANDRGPHYAEVTFAEAKRAKKLRIHETNSAPCVMRVDLFEENGTSHTVFEGGDRTAKGGWLEIEFGTTAYAVKKARVWTARAEATQNEAIEAVELTAVSRETYGYNEFNQLLSIAGNDGATTSFGYDGNGNQVRKQDAGGVTQYVYNADARLVGIALPNGGSNAFEYDANGLRTKKTDSEGTTSYLLDGMSVVAQYAPGGARQAWYTQSLSRIDEVLSVVNERGKFWYQMDALGSTYALANGAGGVVARSGYDVFGVAVAVSGNVGQPFGFTGREHDGGSGLVFARQRYLQPWVGRWTASDRIGFVDGPNTYGYVAGRSTLETDPEGLLGLIQAVGFVSSNISIDAGMRYVGLAVDASDDGLVDFFFAYGLALITTGIVVAMVSGNCGGGGGALKGLGAEEAQLALTGMRSQGGHAIRHLIQEGLIVNKGSLASQVERFRQLVTPILTGPKKVFDWTVGATPGIGYLGEAGGKTVLVIVAKSGQWAGKVIAAIVPDAQQLAIMLAR